MSPLTTTDPARLYGEAAAKLAPAVPKGWYALGPLTRDVRLDYREPHEMWELRMQWGTEITGGRTRHYANAPDGIEHSGRRIEVTLRAATIDALVEALRTLPVRGLEKLTRLPWPTEFSIESVLVP